MRFSDHLLFLHFFAKRRCSNILLEVVGLMDYRFKRYNSLHRILAFGCFLNLDQFVVSTKRGGALQFWHLHLVQQLVSISLTLWYFSRIISLSFSGFVLVVGYLVYSVTPGQHRSHYGLLEPCYYIEFCFCDLLRTCFLGTRIGYNNNPRYFALAKFAVGKKKFCGCQKMFAVAKKKL